MTKAEVLDAFWTVSQKWITLTVQQWNFEFIQGTIQLTP